MPPPVKVLEVLLIAFPATINPKHIPLEIIESPRSTVTSNDFVVRFSSLAVFRSGLFFQEFGWEKWMKKHEANDLLVALAS